MRHDCTSLVGSQGLRLACHQDEERIDHVHDRRLDEERPETGRNGAHTAKACTHVAAHGRQITGHRAQSTM